MLRSAEVGGARPMWVGTLDGVGGGVNRPSSAAGRLCSADVGGARPMFVDRKIRKILVLRKSGFT